jgi:hypothetical protein
MAVSPEPIYMEPTESERVARSEAYIEAIKAEMPEEFERWRAQQLWFKVVEAMRLGAYHGEVHIVRETLQGMKDVPPVEFKLGDYEGIFYRFDEEIFVETSTLKDLRWRLRYPQDPRYEGRVVPPEELENFYDQYLTQVMSENRRSSEHEDKAFLRSIDPAVKRETVRELRRKYAPPDFKEPGRNRRRKSRQ